MTRLHLPGPPGAAGLPGTLSALALLALGAWGAACGPSFQAVYEGDVHFEHCYALDERNAPDDAKKDCWREWLRGYTYGQSNDRVEYAATRFSQLSLDPTLPSEDVRDAGAGRAHKERAIAAPVPTNAFAPPPNVNTFEVRDAGGSTSDAGRDGRDGHDSHDHDDHDRHGGHDHDEHDHHEGHSGRAVANAPGADCVSGCEERWNGCRGSCKDRACDACDRTYRTCVPACFHGEAGAPRSEH